VPLGAPVDVGGLEGGHEPPQPGDVDGGHVAVAAGQGGHLGGPRLAAAQHEQHCVDLAGQGDHAGQRAGRPDRRHDDRVQRPAPGSDVDLRQQPPV
jgi:hypothetical protein